MSKDKSKHGAISFVYPAYNEQDNIADSIARAVSFAKKRNMRFEVIVVDDGSRDRTAEVVKEIVKSNKFVRLLQNRKNAGYGATVWKGLRAARFKLVFLTDSDMQFNLADLDKFLRLIDSHDAVIGFRSSRSDGFMRKINMYGWNILIRTFLGIKIKDVDCAFKLFKTKVIKNIKIQSKGAMFSAELMYRIQKKGFKVTQLPVRHYPRKKGVQTGASPRVIFKAFVELARFKQGLRRD